MRTVDPDLWFRSIRRSSPDTWALPSTDAHLPTRLRHGLEDALREFWLHCSARGLRLQTPRCQTTCGRSLRNVVCVALSLAAAAAVVVHCARQSWLRPPLEMKLLSWQRQVFGEPFPAVALCNNNLVSKKNLDEVTHLLANSERFSNYSEAMIRNHLLQFAALVMMTEPKTKLDYHLTQLLILDTNVTHIMYQLAPKCSSFMSGCAWRGAPADCGELLAMRLTPLGFCCVFNGRYLPEDFNRPPRVLETVGQSSGLVVTYTQDHEDTAYLRRNTNTGMEILIFDGVEYPLLESGVSRLYPGLLNSTMFFSISVTTQNYTNELQDMTDEWRRCGIRDFSKPQHERSYGWCLTYCRHRHNSFICNCVPFVLLPEAHEFVCSPNHLACLNRNKVSFKYLYPPNNTDPGLDEERQTGTFCDVCKPDCARPYYSAEVLHVPYSFPDKIFIGKGSQVTSSAANTTAMHFFFSSNSQELYLVGENVPWYEDVMTISCLWVLFVNMTILTAAEVIFHLTVRWCYHFHRRRVPRRQPRWLTHLVMCFRECTNSDEEELDVHNHIEVDCSRPNHHHGLRLRN